MEQTIKPPSSGTVAVMDSETGCKVDTCGNGRGQSDMGHRMKAFSCPFILLLNQLGRTEYFELVFVSMMIYRR